MFKCCSGQEIFFSSPQIPDLLWVNGYQNSFPRVKRPEHEADHSPPSSAKTKNDWICTSTPSICLQGVDRHNFTFAFTLIFLDRCWISVKIYQYHFLPVPLRFINTPKPAYLINPDVSDPIYCMWFIFFVTKYKS